MKPIKNMRSFAPGGLRDERWMGLGAVADNDEFAARIETAGIANLRGKNPGCRLLTRHDREPRDLVIRSDNASCDLE